MPNPGNRVGLLVFPVLLAAGGACLCTGRQACAATLLLHWTFDETSGLAATDSAGGNDGTLEGFADDDSQWVAGAVGTGALSFGADDYVYVSMVPPVSSQTMCAWVKTSTSWYLGIMGWSDGIPTGSAKDRDLYTNADGTVTYRIWDGGEKIVTSTLTVDDGDWHHIACGFTDGTGIWIYIDGSPDGSAPTGAPYNAYSPPYYTVGIQSEMKTYFDGLIDDVRVYDGALSQAEIETLAARPPEAFALLSPEDGAKVSTTTPVLDWEDSAGAETYSLLVSEDPGLSAPVIDQANLPESTYTVAGALAERKTYYWHVTAHNSADDTPCNADFSFMTPFPPGAFSLTSPGNGTTGVLVTPTLDWGDAPDATSYVVVVADNDSFQAPAVDRIVADSTYALPTALAYETPYWWRVTARNSDGEMPAENNPFTFTTELDTYPPTVTGTDPSDDSTTAPTTTSVKVYFNEPMQATPTEGAISMKDAADGPIEGSASLSLGGVVLTFVPDVELDYEATYTVTVRDAATDVKGNQLDGGDHVFSFTTWGEIFGFAGGEGCAARDVEIGLGALMPCLLLALARLRRGALHSS